MPVHRMTPMSEKPTQKSHLSKTDRGVPTVSTVLANGDLVELIYDRKKKQTAFAVWNGKDWSLEHSVRDDVGRLLVPYSADNNLMHHNVVLFPSEPVEYGLQKKLAGEIRDFIHRYVDLSDSFERIATHYVLFTWTYDGFNELPYLRLRGDFGTGKTRFLQTVGSLCYRSIFVSGASTMSPIFHMLDLFGGTLIIDEADFRFSDEKADMVKILNNGNVRGIPVLRSQINKQREFDPRVFDVFGPKIVAMRGSYEDRALESRFITEHTGKRRLRRDIPINLPQTYQDDTLALRNKLLMYRFKNQGKQTLSEDLVDRSISPRLNQIFAPLLSIVEDEKEREELRDVARRYDRLIEVKQNSDESDDYTWERCW